MSDEEQIEEEPTEEPVETGNLYFSVREAVTYKKIKNATIKILKENTIHYTGLTNYNGNLVIEDVPYDTYTLRITRTGYDDYTNNLTVNGESISVPPFLTPLPKNNDQVEVDLDEPYLFTVTGRIKPDYTMSTQVNNWLRTNLTGLLDDDEHTIFGRVNLGFSEESLRTFGKKPVCDIYIDNIEYSTDFDNQRPVTVNTMVLYYLKGANTQTYNKACELHDYIMQEFLTNEDWQRCNVVRGTSIRNSEVRIQPLNKKWGVIGAFQLTHDLY